MEQAPFIEDSSGEWQDLGDGLKRKIVGHDDRVMMVKVAFEKGAVGSPHHHPHTQVSYVDSGEFEVEIDGHKKNLRKGDCFFVASNLVHGCRCIEPGILIDVFSPHREDFLT